MSWKQWKGDLLNKRVKDAVAKGLFGGGQVIKGEVLQEVPHDTGALSQTVGVFVNPNNKLEVCLSAGGGEGTGLPKIPYAWRWHENPANFQKGRKHNYVRDPVKKHKGQKTVTKVISKELEAVL